MVVVAVFGAGVETVMLGVTTVQPSPGPVEAAVSATVFVPTDGAAASGVGAEPEMIGATTLQRLSSIVVTARLATGCV